MGQQQRHRDEQHQKKHEEQKKSHASSITAAGAFCQRKFSMARNGSGTYSLPSPPTPFANGTVANAPDVNTVLNDLASAMTDSVAADGQTPMTGALNMNNQNITGANSVTAKSLTLGSSAFSLLMRGLINGLTLSNDGTLPNTVIDISAGTCVDSTNASFITFAAFTKNIGGSWTAGSGNNGMGQGLTATASTWYHVFAITNAGASDVYFDTSASAANAPVGTTAFRRIGSIKLDASVHILAFIQNGDKFDWSTPVIEFGGVPGVTTAVLRVLQGVPLGVLTEAILYGAITDGTTGGAQGYISSPAQADLAPASGFFNMSAPGTLSSGQYAVRVMTNASGQIRYRMQTTTSSFSIVTHGWVDTRGRFA